MSAKKRFSGFLPSRSDGCFRLFPDSCASSPTPGPQRRKRLVELGPVHDLRTFLTLHPLNPSTFFPFGHNLPIRNAVAQKRPAAQGKILRRDSAHNEKNHILFGIVSYRPVGGLRNANDRAFRHPNPLSVENDCATAFDRDKNLFLNPMAMDISCSLPRLVADKAETDSLTTHRPAKKLLFFDLIERETELCIPCHDETSSKKKTG